MEAIKKVKNLTHSNQLLQNTVCIQRLNPWLQEEFYFNLQDSQAIGKEGRYSFVLENPQSSKTVKHKSDINAYIHTAI